jgi:hypothetical protein
MNTDLNIIESNVPITKSKKGRKPKKTIETSATTDINVITDTGSSTTDICSSETNIIAQVTDTNEDNTLKNNKKRIEKIVNNSVCDNNSELVINKTEDIELGEKNKVTIAKKRGRKPKGGKIVLQMSPLFNTKETKPNIILHLKCSLKDMQHDFFSNNNAIESFNFSFGKNDLNYEIITNNKIINKIENNNYNNQNKQIFENDDIDVNENICVNSSNNSEIKQIWKKLKQLEYNLHINNISDKKSACFWCTYDFDNPPVYIPKHYIKESYHVYGCFCSPECAAAHLMEENIDSSTKFERYQLLNHIYSKIYDYTKNIKPSPNPYYMLEKYYGNLSIQEYRSLLKNERLFLIVDKPLTRVLPELHEDNDDFIINNKIIPSNNIDMKGKLRKKLQNKSNILNEKFGLS